MSDVYTKCRNCVNFGTLNCPESSLCFALNDKPFYKAKTKLRMKKKHRRAVYLTVIVPIYAVTLPFALIGALCNIVSESVFELADWLQSKLKIYGFKD